MKITFLGGTQTVSGSKFPLEVDSVDIMTWLSGHGDYLELSNCSQQSELNEDTQIQLAQGDPQALEGLHVHLQEHHLLRSMWRNTAPSSGSESAAEVGDLTGLDLT